MKSYERGKKVGTVTTLFVMRGPVIQIFRNGFKPSHENDRRLFEVMTTYNTIVSVLFTMLNRNVYNSLNKIKLSKYWIYEETNDIWHLSLILKNLYKSVILLRIETVYLI